MVLSDSNLVDPNFKRIIRKLSRTIRKFPKMLLKKICGECGNVRGSKNAILRRWLENFRRDDFQKICATYIC